MFYSISGIVAAKTENAVVIRAGGIAYEMFLSASDLTKLPEAGEETTVYTRLIVRENEMYLVGFVSPEERRLFDSLNLVTGIGPKQALKILSELSPSQLRSAIVNGDTAMLARVKGVGAKTAQRIVLELKDRMTKLPETEAAGEIPGVDKKKMEALMAMRVLGYYDAEAKKAIDTVFQDESVSSKEVEDIIRLVLAVISK